MIILGIILTVVGILMLVRPTLVWSITESWKSSDATEPSNLYKLSIRFGGIMCTLAGVSLVIALNL